MRVQPETASTVSDTHAGAVLRRDGWVPDQAERWSIYCFAICVSSEDRTANFQCAGDLIADGLEESFCVFRVRREREAAIGEVWWCAGATHDRRLDGEWEEERLDRSQGRRLAFLRESQRRIDLEAGFPEDE